MRIALTGHRGNVGSRLVKDYGFLPLDVDIRQPKQIEDAITKVKPDIIIHLAGKSNVNWCEEQENQEAVQQINFRGSANVFEQAVKKDIPVIYVSSDHIFSGNGLGSYTENAKPMPKNFYGLSKFAVESLSHVYPNVHIIRTSTLFWEESESFRSIISSIKSGNDVYLPTYMWRSFLHIDNFCQLLSVYCNTEIDGNPKVLNLSGSRVVSWFRFVKDYAKKKGWDASKVHPTFFENEFSGFAPRGHREGLNTNLSKKLGYPQFSYLDGIN
jgi:dTDP-4-dehydrorhamnose reductase